MGGDAEEVFYLHPTNEALRHRESDNLPKVNGRAPERSKIIDAKFHFRQLSITLGFLFLLFPSLSNHP